MSKSPPVLLLLAIDQRMPLRALRWALRAGHDRCGDLELAGMLTAFGSWMSRSHNTELVLTRSLTRGSAACLGTLCQAPVLHIPSMTETEEI